MTALLFENGKPAHLHEGEEEPLIVCDLPDTIAELRIPWVQEHRVLFKIFREWKRFPTVRWYRLEDVCR
jgi:hypothetical protein